MEYDVIIIGFGKGGKTLASTLANQGKKIAVVEKSNKMYGGTCINVGCIPSKSLVNNSLLAKRLPTKHQNSFYQSAIDEKRWVVEMLRQKNFDKLNNHPNITIYDGIGSFEDEHTIKVTNNQDVKMITGETIYINTGAKSFIPNIVGIEDNEFIYYSDSLMDKEELPQELIIIGGGYISMEFASMYTNFGSHVSILQNEDIFLPREDNDISENIEYILKNKGVDIYESVDIVNINKDTILFYQKGKECRIKGDTILVATGRRPNVEELEVKNAGIELTKRGAIKVDDNLKTSVDNIYALGDVHGGLQFTYTSLDDYRIIMNNLNGNNYNLTNRINVPYSVFMDPPLSRVGLSETQAKQQGLNYQVVTMATSVIPKAQVSNRTEGMLKAIIDNNTGKILGAALLCEDSYEMINIIKLAMDFNASYKTLANQIFTHPTMSEALNDLFSLVK